MARGVMKWMLVVRANVRIGCLLVQIQILVRIPFWQDT